MIRKSSKPTWASLSKASLALLAAAAAGCSVTEGPKVPAELLSKEQPRQARPQDLESIRKASLDLACLHLEKGSSSLPLLDAYGLVRLGALAAAASEGPTLESISDGLGLKDRRTDRFLQAHAGITRKLVAPGSGLHSAGSWWMVWPIAVTPEFHQTAATSLGIPVRRLGSAGLGATDTIQAWIQKQLGGEAPPLSLAKTTPMVSVTAFRPQGRWKSPFDLARTREEGFRGEDGSFSTTILMQGSPVTLSGETPAGAAVILEGEGDWEMILIKPRRTVAASAKVIREEGLAKVLKPLVKRQTLVFLPRFRTKGLASTEDLLGSSRLKALMEPGLDLRYMSLELRASDPPRWLQAWDLAWNEDGLRGSASPPLEKRRPDPPQGQSQFMVKLDRPFLWILRHKSLELVLASGSVSKAPPAQP